MSDELRTLNPETEEPYSSRFRDASAARTFWQNLKEGDDSAAKERSQVRNQIDGGKPFDPAALKRMAQTWRANHNFKTAKADLKKIEIPYWRLVDSAPKVANMELLREEPEAPLWRDVMEEEYDREVKGWKKYHHSILTLNHEHCLFGFGGAFFPDERDWTWTPVGRSEAYVPRQTEADIEDQEILCVRRKMPPTALWKLVMDDDSTKRADEGGWNTDEVKKVLMSVGRGETQNSGIADWEEVQDQIRNNDLHLYESGLVKLVYIFVKEFDETITKYIIPEEDWSSDEKQSQGTAEQYLFEQKDYKDFMYKILGTMFFDIGTGDWHSVKGFGQDNFNHAMVENRSMNRVLDMFTLSASLGLKDQREQGINEVPIRYMGPVFVIPNGLEEYDFKPDIANIVGIRNLFRENSQENTQSYGNTAQRVADAETASQGEMIAALDSAIDQAQAGLYLSQFGSNILQEMFERIRSKDQNADSVAGKSAKAFQKRCIDRGVPEDVLHESVVIVTAGGDSSMANPAHRLRALNNVLSVSANQNINERNAYIDWVAAQFGLSSGKRYINPDTDANLTDSASYAQLENVAFESGKEIPVLASQVHENHIPIHLLELGQITDAYDSAGEITPQGHAALSVGVPHVEVHQQYLEAQPNKAHIASQFAPLIQAVKGKLEGINVNMERERVAQFQQQQEQQAQPTGTV